MKKLIVLMMVLILSLSLVACGEEITLVSTTVNDLTFDVPSDFGEFADSQGVMVAKNDDSTATIAVSGRMDAEGVTTDLWDEQTYIENVLAGFAELEVLEFNNAQTIAGTTAVFAHFTAKNNSNIAIEAYSYLIYFDDGNYQTISFNTNVEKDTSLKQNMDAIVSSVK